MLISLGCAWAAKERRCPLPFCCQAACAFYWGSVGQIGKLIPSSLPPRPLDASHTQSHISQKKMKKYDVSFDFFSSNAAK